MSDYITGRRRYLHVTGAIAVALGAGCLDDDEPADDTVDDEMDDDLEDDGEAADDDIDDPDDDEDDDLDDEPDDDEDDIDDEDVDDEDDVDDDEMDDEEDDAVDDEEEEEDDDVNDEEEEVDFAVTVVVGHEGDLVFDPETVEIEPGETVEFVWEGDGHNIIVVEQPNDADWEGVPDIQDDGYTHTHTFDVEGRYEYICEPHEGQGMEGEILVGDVEATDDGEAADETDDENDDGY